jgi:hypothetical protein
MVAGSNGAKMNIIEGVKPWGYMWCLTLTFDVYVYSSFSSTLREVAVNLRDYGLNVSYNICVSADRNHSVF